MRFALPLLAALVLASGGASACVVEDLPPPNNTAQYDAMMRALMLAHAPIEYRKSCGIRTEDDIAFFEAIKKGAGCEASEAYQSFLGGFLRDEGQYLLAVRRTDLRADEDFDKYCAIVGRIDLSAAVKEDGMVDASALQAQAPLFHAIQEIIATRRWNE